MLGSSSTMRMVAGKGPTCCLGCEEPSRARLWAGGAARIGHGLCAVVEITLDRQDQAALEAFELKVAQDEAVQQCYRVSPGPDFCLVVHTRDMPDYLALTQRLFTFDTNVRNVKTFFSIKRSKFGARVPLPAKT